MSDTHITVHCPAGAITGVLSEDGVAEFRDIPHATFEQPFDPSRMTPPADPDTPIDATEVRQRPVGLTVIAPADTMPSRSDSSIPADLPVIAYVHGGRYESDHFDGSWYRAHSFAEDGVIVVSIGYRMKFEGFAQFKADEPQEYRGINDVAVGLEWIQKNIEAFGGDPTNVTLMGQSAGGGIVLWLARRDHYTGLFRRAIAMSPGYPPRGFFSRRRTLRSFLGKPITQTSLNKVAARKPEKLAKAYTHFRRRYPFGPAVGPYPFIADELSDIDILVTFTEDELALDPVAAWLDRHLPFAAGLGVRVVGSGFGLHSPASYLNWVRSHYPGQVHRRFASDSSILRWVHAATSRSKGNTWLIGLMGAQHRIDDSPGDNATVAASKPQRGIRALHCVDILLAFKVLDHPSPLVRRFTDADPGRLQPRADQFHQLIVDFASSRVPSWPRYVPGRGERKALALSLDQPTAPPRIMSDPLHGVRVHFSLPTRSYVAPKRNPWE